MSRAFRKADYDQTLNLMSLTCISLEKECTHCSMRGVGVKMSVLEVKEKHLQEFGQFHAEEWRDPHRSSLDIQHYHSVSLSIRGLLCFTSSCV